MTISQLADVPAHLKSLISGITGKPAAETGAMTELVAAVTELEHQNGELKRENDYLREQLQLLKKRHFGTSSEKLSKEQLLLMLQNDLEGSPAVPTEPDPTVPVQGHARRKGGRRPFPAAWPRETVMHDLPPEQKVCPHDGHPLKPIGQETSEQLSYRPAEKRVLLHVRPKYACPVCEEGVAIAPPPAQLIPKSMATPSLLAHVVVSKYADALPLYRQEQIFARQGIDLPRSTLASWMIRCGEVVQAIINLLRDELLLGPIIQCDETRTQVLKEPGKKAESLSYIWAQRGKGSCGKPVILFEYDPTRSGEVPKRLLADYEGYVQVDEYAGYDAFFRENPKARRVGCMAHCRRKFSEAFKVQQKAKGKRGKAREKRLRESKAFQGLTWIRKLYDLEAEARGMTAQERYALRQARGQPILEEIRTWLQEAKPLVPPQSLTGKALSYMSDHWVHLTRYLEDGRLEIDNNGVENAIRPIALGRKNWLFHDTVRGAQASANLYSLIETAKANGLDPLAYLTMLFRDLPHARRVEDYEQLLPTQWTNDRVREVLAQSTVPV